MSRAEEQGLTAPPPGTPERRRSRAGHLKTVITRTHLLPAFLVLTVMMVALWLMGMPFLQALTISTGVKIAVALPVFRRQAPQP
ncbi:hypothetical protein BX286_0365 [Streptomyces sp. 3211.6]|uniref:hypothetical protein n=1 Tax=Streptomyces sp. 3211.6 TaxID=1938845 RepID=UPI000C2C28A6|nr:hypothetical protein [Streptomyces sp. 3211.6]RKT02461.1 hypothetical protein BX286_0365 [Streptomyces sp. 3211.6]